MADRFGPEPAAGFTAKQNRTLLIVLPIVLIIGCGLTGWGASLITVHADLSLNGETATGEVVGLESGTSTSSSGRPAWFPIVRFETRDGVAVTFRHRTGRSPAAYAKGDRVEVVYLPGATAQALIAEGFLNWLLPVVLVLIGPGMVFVSVRGIRGARRRLRPSERPSD